MSDWKLPRRQRRWEARLRGLPYRSSVSNQPHYVKMYFITQFLPDSTREAVYPMRALQLAAVEIQRVVRGRGLRQRFKSCDWHNLSTRERLKKARQLSRPPLLKLNIPDSKPNSMLSKYLQFVRVRETARIELPGFAGGGFAVWCAARIQSWWRMLKQKWHFNLLRFRMYHIASQQIQYMVKSYLRIGPEHEEMEKKEKEKVAKKQQQQRRENKQPKFNSIRDEAAYKLQSLWWRHANKRVYKYFHDLIQFRLCGNPASLLRTINPREASLFDKATGIHVRFRLGGHSFPPTLYYKVFLLNPLCDVGSFAPRDYAYTNKHHIEHQKYQNNMLTSKLHDYGMRKTNNTSSSFGFKVSSPLSNMSSCDSRPGSEDEENNVGRGRRSHGGSGQVSLSLNATRPPSTTNSYQRHLRQVPSSPQPPDVTYSSRVKSRRSSASSYTRPTSTNQQEAAGAEAEEEMKTSTLGQIRVGNSYFGTKIDNIGSKGTSNWYKRVENNGWRAVTGKKAHEAASIENKQQGNDIPRHELADAPRGAYDDDDGRVGGVAFHYSRLKRKEDKEKTRKSKKIDWLKHMYEEGLAKERGEGKKEEDEQQQQRFSNDKTAVHHNNQVAVDDELGDEFALDEELLTWSKNLDYDSYVANWHVLATSGTSGNNYHIPTKANTHEMVPEPDWVALKKQFDA